MLPCQVQSSALHRPGGAVIIDIPLEALDDELLDIHVGGWCCQRAAASRVVKKEGSRVSSWRLRVEQRDAVRKTDATSAVTGGLVVRVRVD